MTKQIFLFALLLLPLWSSAQSPFNAFQWRCIGPHRGGRTVGAVGVAQEPNVFYIGVNNGGVWKTTDYGRTWNPIFDDQPTGSIGDVAVAPSNPKVIYVASGEGIQRPDLSTGDGIYKSIDAGKTWAHVGLREGLQIGGLAIDPRNPDRVFAAVLGHPYGPNAERGVFRTTDGGKTWKKVHFINENTGAIQVSIDPSNPSIVYADVLSSRLAPWENGRWYGAESALYKSTDGGDTWKKLGKGLPTASEGLDRIGFCICPSLPTRLYATVSVHEGKQGGIYRSDDSGENWYRLSADERYWGRGDDFAEIKADPKNPDIVYSANVVCWKSSDGGHSWSALRGAPGGDDSHRIWINPDNPNIILLAGDQGAIISVNGGQTWSSWYNQPTAQFYHVATDNAFPYNVYGGQQESGSVGIASRGNDGHINFRDWHPVGVEEYGYVAPDPLDPNIIYGGKISRYDKRTGQAQNIAPEAIRSGKYRYIRTMPVLFSPIDPKTLFFAGNVVFKTADGGHSWLEISPDLTRETWDIPTNVGIFSAEATKTDKRQRGVVYALSPSPVDANTIWAGTDDGLIWLTRKGGGTQATDWTNVTPPNLPAWSKISQIDASHTDVNTCYVAVNAIRLDDQRPHVLRTRDGGKTWVEIINGLPNDPINSVKEDPKRPGLLFAGSERMVHVSEDDGANWRSLRLNMPATSIRDLVIKDDDLVVGTHGRSFWILDDISPLRETVNVSKEPAFLFAPALATRVRWNMNTDTPIPQEEPAGQNPPDGAILNYYLKNTVSTPISLEILDASGKVIRRYASNDPKQDLPNNNVPPYWVRPQQILSAEAGAHRFCWDLHLQPLDERLHEISFPIAATYQNTAPEPTSPWALPGRYTVRLTVDGRTYEQFLDVRMDPRIKTAPADLQLQYDLSLRCYEQRNVAYSAVSKLNSMRAQIAARLPNAPGKLAEALRKTDLDAAALLSGKEGISANIRQLDGLMNVIQESDFPPTLSMRTQTQAADAACSALLDKIKTLLEVDVARLNGLLRKNKASEIKFLDDYPEFARHPESTNTKFWKPLFNADLSNAEFPKGIWFVQNGELSATEDQCIWSKKQYGDFQLDLEFKTAKGTNSGIIFHCSNTANWIPFSLEVQIADDWSEQWATAPSTWQCGAVFGHLAAKKHAVRKAGEWNHCTVTCRDRKIWVVLNGELVNEMDMSLHSSGTTNLNGTSIPSWLSTPFSELPLRGAIGFQGKHAGADIWFRNVRVRE